MRAQAAEPLVKGDEQLTKVDLARFCRRLPGALAQSPIQHIARTHFDLGSSNVYGRFGAVDPGEVARP